MIKSKIMKLLLFFTMALAFNQSKAITFTYVVDNYVAIRYWEIQEEITAVIGPDGVFRVTAVRVNCNGAGDSDCKSKYQRPVADNPLTEPESALVDDLYNHAIRQLGSGTTTGTRKKPITVQGPTGTFSKIYTVTWTAAADGSAMIKIEDSLFPTEPPTGGE